MHSAISITETHTIYSGFLLNEPGTTIIITIGVNPKCLNIFHKLKVRANKTNRIKAKLNGRNIRGLF